jgi:hypothetical protein
MARSAINPSGVVLTAFLALTEAQRHGEVVSAAKPRIIFIHLDGRSIGND